MAMRRFLLYLLLLFGHIYGDYIDTSLQKSVMLPYCSYLLVPSGKYSFEEIKSTPALKWSKTERSTLSLGFKNGSDLWIKCRLKNPLKKRVHRILETDNPHTGYVTLYDNGIEKVSGALLRGESLKQLSPIFNIFLEPLEEREIYLKLSSPLSTLKAEPILWSPSGYREHETKKHFMLGIFFGAMGALLVYNLFILIFTRDVAYLWYCAYLFGIIVFMAQLTGVLEAYVLRHSLDSRLLLNLTIALPLFFIPLFTRYFLITEKTMPNIDIFLKLLPLYYLTIVFIENPKLSINLFVTPNLIFIIVAILAIKKRLPQSTYYAAGWLVVIASLLLVATMAIGAIPSFTNWIYIPQTGFLFEALIFSIGLASRINTLKEEKEAADRKLLEFHKNEKDRLQQLVSLRTKELSTALDEKNTLLKEIHHRVKNNLQTIVSLLQLQSSKLHDADAKEMIRSAQNRIGSMSKLHEMLYRKDTIVRLNTNEYFQQIVNEISSSYPDSNFRFIYDISIDLVPEKAVYCGLIVNELVTNSLKYAFDKDDGTVWISLKKSEDLYTLSVCDNGKGIREEAKRRSIGLKLVKALTKQQLKGDIRIFRNGGTKIFITFRE